MAKILDFAFVKGVLEDAEQDTEQKRDYGYPADGAVDFGKRRSWGRVGEEPEKAEADE